MKKGGRATLCILASVAAHAGLVLALALPHGGQGTSPMPSRAFQVRLVTAAAAAGVDAAGTHPHSPAPPLAAVMPPVAEIAPPPLDVATLAQPVALAAPAGPALPSLQAAATPDRPRYYLPSELDERPRVVGDVFPDQSMAVPDVPPQDLVVRLMINGEGRVDDVVIEQARDDGPGAANVRDVVRRAFLQVVFAPGRLRGINVNSQMRIQVHLDAPVQVQSRVAVH